MRSRRTAWVLLAYRLPREPSRPPSALWRKLRRLGAAQVLEGLAAFPLTRATASSWSGLPTRSSRRAESDGLCHPGRELTLLRRRRELADPDHRAADYRPLIEEAEAARGLYEYRKRALLTGRDPA